MPILLSSRKHNPVKIVELANELGFDGIELVMHPHDQHKEHPDWSLNDLEHVYAIHAPVAAYDQNRFQFALNDALTLADLLQSSVVNIHPPSMHEEFGGRRNVDDGIKLILEQQAKWPRRKICYEVLQRPASEKHLLQQAYASPAAWAEDIKEHKLYATLDTTHIASWGENPATYVPLLGKYLELIHLSDYSEEGGQHLFPGEGDINWPQFFAALKKTGQKDLTITFEPAGKFDLSKKKERGRLAESLQFIQKLMRK